MNEITSLANTKYSIDYRIGKLELSLIVLSILSLFLINEYDLDFTIADYIYQNTHWSYKYDFWTDGVMHRGARIAAILIYVFLLIKFFKYKLNQTDNDQSFHLKILLVSVISSVFAVVILKHTFNADCPWDLLKYGGDRPFYPIMNYNNEVMDSKHCFPAAHASVGYSWVALYFYFKVTNNKFKYWALAAALMTGMVFGFVQQIRGAHFLSHDISSLLVCLIISSTIYSLAYSLKTDDKITNPKEKITNHT